VHEKGQPPNPDRFIGMGKNGEGFPRFNVTDKNGDFHITHLSPGDYELVVLRRFANQGIGELADSAMKQQFFPERFEKVTIEEGKETTIDIDLKSVDSDAPTAKLAGRCVINGRPGANVPLRYNVAMDPEARNDRNSRSNAMARMKATVTSDNGSFDFGEVVAGDGSIEVMQPGEKGGMNVGRVARVPVKLAANDVKNDLRIELRVGAIHGRVVADRNSQPLAMADIRLRLEPKPVKDGALKQNLGGDWNADVRMNVITDKDGAFVFDFVPEGRYELNVNRKEYAPSKVAGVVVPPGGEPPEVVARLVTGVTVRGKVVLPPQQPGEDASERRWAFLMFRGAEGQVGNNGGRVDTEKWTFEAADLMPGKYDVTCWTGSQQLKSVALEVPSQGLENVTLTFEVAPPPPPDPTKQK